MGNTFGACACDEDRGANVPPGGADAVVRRLPPADAAAAAAAGGNADGADDSVKETAEDGADAHADALAGAKAAGEAAADREGGDAAELAGDEATLKVVAPPVSTEASDGADGNLVNTQDGEKSDEVGQDKSAPLTVDPTASASPIDRSSSTPSTASARNRRASLRKALSKLSPMRINRVKGGKKRAAEATSSTASTPVTAKTAESAASLS